MQLPDEPTLFKWAIYVVLAAWLLRHTAPHLDFIWRPIAGFLAAIGRFLAEFLEGICELLARMIRERRKIL